MNHDIAEHMLDLIDDMSQIFHMTERYVNELFVWNCVLTVVVAGIIFYLITKTEAAE